MPRHGVGLNELLGGGGCRLKPSPDTLAERRSGKARTRTCELSVGCNRSSRISSGQPDLANHGFRSPGAQSMRSVSAPNGLDRRSNAAGSRSKSCVNRSRQSHRVEKQSNQTLFCRLTPELSRAERGGWESVLPACSEVSTKPRHGVGLNDLLGGKEAGEGEATAHLPKGRSRNA